MQFESRATVGLPVLGGVSTNITPGSGGSTIHYVGGAVGLPSSVAHSRCQAKVREIHNWHVRGNGWAFFAYSVAVCQHGIVMEGRGVRRRTAANGTNAGNQSWYAVLALVGGSEQPSAAMVQGIKDAVAYLRSSGGAASRVNGHRDHLSTSCPGSPLYAMVRAGVFGSGGSAAPATPPSSGGGSTSYEAYNRTAKPGDRVLRLYSVGDDVKAAQKAVGTKDDGYFGPNTVAAVRAYQSRHGLSVDGVVGPQTWGRILGSTTAPKPPASSSKAPPWPGPLLSHPPLKKSDTARRWQSQMRARGWRIDIDGWYGPASKQACQQFQREKKLKVDGIVGPATWRATWESPIT